MGLLKVENLSHRFADKVLYENGSFNLYKNDHMGIVGQNGAGKSTLMEIIIGQVLPDEGSIKWQANVKIGHLDQYADVDRELKINDYLQLAFSELFAIEQRMTALYEESAVSGDDEPLLKAAECQEQLEMHDFYAIESTINKIVVGLGIDAIGIDRQMKTLSGGQRAKVILAKLLLEKPNVLLLDEPTNFLDKEHVEWLASYLNEFQGAFIVISHDYEFLEKIATCICDIEFGTIKKYNGKYSAFLKQKEHLREDYIRQYSAQQKKIKETEEFIRKNIAGINTKMAQGRRKHLEKMDRLTEPNFTQKPTIKFKEVPLASHKVLTVNHLSVGYDQPLLKDLNFSVLGNQKIVITGFNGIGKSTLLKTLVGVNPSLAGGFQFAPQVKVGYYEQDLIWENGLLTPIQVVSDAHPKLTVKEIRRHLAQCGVNDKHVTQAVGTLSGGEQAKVKLCILTLKSVNFLMMDEPTNHLDVDAKEALQEALIAFQGTVLLVSHEEKFYRDWADKVLSIGQDFE
ncbi:ABC-F family ATP-binding cassette domain-containing protein [Isobaculum melis]|uniref:ATPase components of ABC transporters with duplicated ATPase domains n=1 Tax=Isobaculum melis TaxID=142588 RepID=A0A1H9S6B0_9LACT|nr:ABC-F family ATP-binding cassette domain-containing protein [Isobaculum melis]SER80572.1 ATPase components of ABC transporters with duplicated ATPase domains [Isobaculum melis]